MGTESNKLCYIVATWIILGYSHVKFHKLSTWGKWARKLTVCGTGPISLPPVLYNSMSLFNKAGTQTNSLRYERADRESKLTVCGTGPISLPPVLYNSVSLFNAENLV